ncbi:DEHA2E04576p [Debaryomyces hansenii CBS767]|uniref:3-ketodihydrosphingosine reductase TSC10 n=1 Tax=Debaryomyces hansenii (strain ATCC 36239 / CBS 767 / BCRC 21394 / JCM 1990 / NBRC 0083 / IGC 2968) TaxID=284592 RepID=KDSR_DEBHA|nr:DEHA2E04576p [Debaryomyces hansenii CBS767]Q6BQK1.2 RecName: Full=3-ketodihydrosphingosine reductase TSC10; AltName: Full=3-dehydrosphinganine reductase; AltName: Full=KDS reductase [Debaryomyces hansenii CBS767]CAG87745.2 DEHA2E04576p [Debaryomyces hansenii CBS767]|eukprot:XP_459519.2 DEHA2E04576p [Debaryomyces hansenii CBS767]
MLFSNNKIHAEGKLALIVGASQGLGADLALKLYQQNCSVILVARTETKLVAQIERIQSSSPENNATLSYKCCDASNYEDCVKLWNDLIVDQKQDPDFIFCCAGSSIPKLFSDLTAKDFAIGINTNYTTSLNITHTGFKQVLGQFSDLSCDQYKKRHVIFVSSVVSFYPFIGYSQYAPLKSAIQSLSIILRQEMGPFNYRVSCVFPGNFQSEGYEEEQKTKPSITKSIEGSSKPISGEDCADIILNQLNRGYDTVTTDFIGWLLGCSVLGVLPRSWGFFQVIVSFIFSIIAPIANYVVYRDVLKFFKTRSTREVEEYEIVSTDDNKKTL